MLSFVAMTARSERRADARSVRGKCRRIRRVRGMDAEVPADIARDHMEVQVEDTLSRGRPVQLGDHDAGRGKRLLDRACDFLRGADRRGDGLGRRGEKVLACRLRHDERVSLRLRHDVQEGDRVRVLVDLVAGDLPADDAGEDVVLVVGHLGPLMTFPHGARYARALAGQGVSRSPIAWTMGEANNEVPPRHARNPQGPSVIRPWRRCSSLMYALIHLAPRALPGTNNATVAPMRERH